MSITGRILITGLILGGLLVRAAGCIAAMVGPDIVALDTLAAIYQGVTFDHAMHADMASCAACHHHTTGMPAEDARCVRCHATTRGETDEVACVACHAVTSGSVEKMKGSPATNLFHTVTAGLKRAYHVQCLGCHREMATASGCEDCHVKRSEKFKTDHSSAPSPKTSAIR